MAQRADRFDIYLAVLDPVSGSEIATTRPCAVVSPDEMNQRLRTVILVPLTSKPKHYSFRVPVDFGGVLGEWLKDHVRSVDKSRLVSPLGLLDRRTSEAFLSKLVAILS